MAGGAFPGESGVLSLEREAGFGAVVEVFGVERPEVGIDALMLDVTNLAVARDLAVDAFFRGDAGGDRTMAGEALLGNDGVVLSMAFPAVRGALESGVCFREGTGGFL